MIVGEPPFPGSMASVVHSVTTEEPDPPSDHVGGLPRGTDAVLQQALAMEKDDRYESVLDLRRDLNTLCERALGRGDEGQLIANTGSPMSEATPVGPAPSTTEHGIPEQPVSRQPQTDPGNRIEPETGGENPEAGGMRNVPETAREYHQTENAREPASENQQNTTLTLPRYHYYAGGSAIVFLMGVASVDGGGAIFAIAGLIGMYYYFNKDVNNLLRVPDTGWSPRKSLYFLVLWFYGLVMIYYWYRRREVTSRPDVDSQLPPLLRRFA
jgi:hypothetical protein